MRDDYAVVAGTTIVDRNPRGRSREADSIAQSGMAETLDEANVVFRVPTVHRTSCSFAQAQ